MKTPQEIPYLNNVYLHLNFPIVTDGVASLALYKFPDIDGEIAHA